MLQGAPWGLGKIVYFGKKLNHYTLFNEIF